MRSHSENFSEKATWTEQTINRQTINKKVNTTQLFTWKTLSE